MARYTTPGRLLLANSLKSAVATAAVVISVGGWLAFGVISPASADANLSARPPVVQGRSDTVNQTPASRVPANIRSGRQSVFSAPRARTRSSR